MIELIIFVVIGLVINWGVAVTVALIYVGVILALAILGALSN